MEQVSIIIRMFNGKGLKSRAYLSTLLTYIGAVLPEKRRTKFLEIISSNHEAGDAFMRSVAESLQYEGWIKGKKRGREEKAREDETTIKEKDTTIGELDAKMKAIVRNLLSREMSANEIHRITGFSVYKIKKNELEISS